MCPREQEKEFFAKRGEPLKVQLIDEKTAGQKDVSCYTIKDPETFIDFCVGPHVPSTGRLKAFKLLSASNAYWKGDARNQPMQRIYGTAFLAEADLKAHLQRIEEAKKRDHRKLGRELKLFWFHPWAAGEPFWLPKGTTLVHRVGQQPRPADAHPRAERAPSHGGVRCSQRPDPRARVHHGRCAHLPARGPDRRGGRAAAPARAARVRRLRAHPGDEPVDEARGRPP